MQYVIGIMGFIIMGLAWYSSSLIHKNAELEQRLAINDSIVESQNKAIEQIIIDSEKYACSLDAMEDFTKSKYERVKHEHEYESCEAKLKAFEEALHIYSE